VADHPVKQENAIFLPLPSKRYRRKSTQRPLLLKEQELVLVSNSSASLKRYKRKLHSSEEVCDA
jgi:hypothetical protein